MLEFGARLNESVLLVKCECSEAELNVNRRAIGEIIEPTGHQDGKPEGSRGGNPLMIAPAGNIYMSLND